MKLPVSMRLEPDSSDLPQQLSSLKKAAGIYALSVKGAAPHLGWSTNLERRLKRLLLSSPSGSDSLLARLRDRIVSIDCWRTGSRLESSLLMYELARQYFPGHYGKLLKLRIPWFLGLTVGDPFPRIEVINRVPARPGVLFGPFASRGIAQQYQEELLSLFQLRRCTESLTPHPEHPGCIYGEMNQCLRPCQCAVSAQEYESEAVRVSDFLRNNGRSAFANLSTARDRACEEMQFEQAAQIHKRIEKIKTAAGLRDPVVRNLDQFGGVALTRSADRERFVLWPMVKGYWQEPIALEFRANEPSAKSLDADLRELLTGHLAAGQLEGSRAEALAIFSRWYYSSWRDGFWFPFESIPELNYRKLVRQVSKMANESTATNP